LQLFGISFEHTPVKKRVFMKRVSKRWMLLAIAAGLLGAWACNSGRSTNENDSTMNTDAAPGDTVATAAGPEGYTQTLTFKQYTFTVNQQGEGALRKMTITGKDSVNDLDELNEPVEGSIYYAAATDMDKDGKPELFAFARGTDTAGGYSKVYAYAFDGKTGKQIDLPELSASDKAGYMGHDSVYIEKDQLVRQFPIYKSGAGDPAPTGKVKTIRYTLRPGNEGPRLEQVQQ
jgi:hypothetical protein